MSFKDFGVEFLVSPDGDNWRATIAGFVEPITGRKIAIARKISDVVGHGTTPITALMEAEAAARLLVPR
jgi:hypothetical protein